MNRPQGCSRNFVKPTSQFDVMLNNVHHRTIGATVLSALAVFLGGYANVAQSFLASPATASTSTPGAYFPTLALGILFVVGGLATVLAKIGKLQWETVAECVSQVDDAVTRVSSNATIVRIKSSVSTSSMRFVELAGHRWHGGGSGAGAVTERRTLTISAPEPFLPLDQIAQLSLSDVKNLLRFAVDNNRLDFCSQAFLSELSPGARQAAEAITRVAASSRGKKTALSTPSLVRCEDTEADHAASNMDALSFAAAVRIFAEWRSLRLVPGGYQRYAVAMTLAKRDVVQNVQKIETAAHSWMAHREGSRKSAVDLANGRQVCRQAEGSAGEARLHF